MGSESWPGLEHLAAVLFREGQHHEPTAYPGRRSSCPPTMRATRATKIHASDQMTLGIRVIPANRAPSTEGACSKLTFLRRPPKRSNHAMPTAKAACSEAEPA